MTPITNIQIMFVSEDELKEAGMKRVNLKMNAGFYFATRKETNGSFTVYIPCYDICFSTRKEEDIASICKSSIGAFVKFHIKEEDGVISGTSVDKFVRKLKVMGFVPMGDMWDKVLSNKSYNGRVFNAFKTNIPKEFTQSQLQYGSMEIAA